jgi:hypothetical protein
VTVLTEIVAQTGNPREAYVCTVDAVLVFPALASFESMLDETRCGFNTCMRGQRSLFEYAVH